MGRGRRGDNYGKEPPSQPPNEEVTTAKQGFEHFDRSMRVHQLRHEYENIGPAFVLLRDQAPVSET
ncbi:MAG: hypothetical protein OXC14_19045 [Rhodospirillaceae bacterium]|nr:hypothetical protein [Rhodospirillaceae bacterium]